MIIATFSNGTTDIYAGDRDVTAAWAIFHRATGELIDSGHSLDRVRAAKTASGKLQHLSGRLIGLTPEDKMYYTKGSDWRDSTKVKRDKRNHNAERLAMISAAVRIEVVDLK